MQRYLIFINYDDVVVWSKRSRLLQEDEFVKFLTEGQPTAPQYFPYNVQLNIVSEMSPPVQTHTYPYTSSLITY